MNVERCCRAFPGCSVVFVVVLIATAVGECLGTDPDALRAIRILIERNHVLPPFPTGRQIMAQRDADFQSFSELLKTVAESDAPRDPSEFEEELVTVAASYAENPGLMNELVEVYGNPMPGTRGFSPRMLSDSHATEKVCLAWEGLVIAPQSWKVSLLRQRAFDALGKIADTRSVPVLVEAFRLMTLPDVQVHRVSSLEKFTLRALAMMPDEKVLQGILRCLALHDDRAGKPSPEVRGAVFPTPREIVLQKLLQPGNEGKSDFQREGLAHRDRWWSVIKNYNKPQETVANEKFLQVLKGLRKFDPEDYRPAPLTSPADGNAPPTER